MTLDAPHAAVHPIGLGGARRGLPTWFWPVVFIVLAAHVLAVIVLSRLGVIQTPLTPPDDTVVTVDRYVPVVQPQPPQPRPSQPRPIQHPLEVRPTQTPPIQTQTQNLQPVAHASDQAQVQTPLSHPQPPVDTGAQQPTAPTVINQPRWLSQPSADAMARFYPAQASDQNIEGRAVIRCGVTVAGTLAECVVVSESPRGWGFGRAALQLAPYFRMTPRTEDGRPVGGAQVDVALQFKL